MIFALSKLASVRRWLVDHLHVAHQFPLDHTDCTLCCLANDVAELHRSDRSTPIHSTTMLMRGSWAPVFAGFAQQDIHEAFQFLMQHCDTLDSRRLHHELLCSDCVITDFQNSEIRHTTPYNQIFGNLQLVTVTCTACGHTSRKYERAHSLALALHQNNHVVLEQLLADQFRRETLDDCYRCEACHVAGAAEKETQVLHWPAVLALSLKRFHFDVQLQRPEKIQRHVAFPLQLTVATGVIYHLQAIVVHSGRAGGGHYTAYVRASDGSWYYCDDSARPQRVVNLRDILRQ